jgi:hypothetical protein
VICSSEMHNFDCKVFFLNGRSLQSGYSGVLGLCESESKREKWHVFHCRRLFAGLKNSNNNAVTKKIIG